MIPNQNFETYIMSDLIMNNEVAVLFMAVDESLKTTKRKGGLFLKIFSQTDDVEGTCSIISKKVVRGDHDLRGIPKKKFPIGSDFIRIRINKVKNTDIAIRFVEGSFQISSFSAAGSRNAC